jgi:hypothetical protein
MNKPSMLHFSYKRYLINILREYLDFEGVPIRIVARKKGERIDDDELNVVYQELMVPKELYIDSDIDDDDLEDDGDYYDDDEEYLDDEYEDEK